MATSKLSRLKRQFFMPQVTRPEQIEDLLRHPALAERAILERALSNRFFAPFAHQEVVNGTEFVARSAWSKVALAQLPDHRIDEAASRATQALGPGPVDSLLDSVRACAVAAMHDLTLGTTELVALSQAAVRDMDRGIKLIGRPNIPLRRSWAEHIGRVLRNPTQGPASLINVAPERRAALTERSQTDHVASVFLGTGSIQVSDVVTHALIALAQFPLSKGADDAAVIAETVRLFPVNSSITRQSDREVTLFGRNFEKSDPMTVVPQKLDRDPSWDPRRHQEVPSWSFGAGPRACPAKRLALRLSEQLLQRFRAAGVTIEEGYEHRRSLAFPARARFGHGDTPTRTPFHLRVSQKAAHLAIIAETYPRALGLALPELAELLSEP